MRELNFPDFGVWCSAVQIVSVYFSPYNMHAVFSFLKNMPYCLGEQRNPVTFNILFINTYEGLSQMCTVEQ